VALIVAARRSGVGRDCRVGRRSAAAAFAFERVAAAVALDVHFEDGGVVNEAVDDSDRHSPIWENLAPLAKGLVGSDQEGSPSYRALMSSKSTLVSAWSLVT
jgi:hypothetical protein